MKPEDVDDELVTLARKRIVGAADIALREMLAAVLPLHEEQLRAERDELKAAIERARALANRAMLLAEIGKDYVDASTLLAALDTPSTPESPARPDGCNDPDCSRTECLHLGTCFEDAMWPPESPESEETSDAS